MQVLTATANGATTVSAPLDTPQATSVQGIAQGIAHLNVSAENEQDLMFMAGS
ncbi:hypothetical protein KI688_000656 [Linnemannia hyalina]|uniref:Uncharacterized protein n=1 Tax=Linnemannia hyalina TaxID=64524 RepID=A0A9P7Y4N5_9FUNG|nr:hypothetical protein KI688_000656 [Linnemannia hyalina]